MHTAATVWLRVPSIGQLSHVRSNDCRLQEAHQHEVLKLCHVCKACRRKDARKRIQSGIQVLQLHQLRHALR